MKDYHTLKFWRKAHELTLGVYRMTRSFPDDERFGLTSQLRRASVSIGSNIAEGCGRDSDADFKRFLTYSTGSCSEVEYQLELATDLGYAETTNAATLLASATEVRRMITAYARTLN